MLIRVPLSQGRPSLGSLSSGGVPVSGIFDRSAFGGGIVSPEWVYFQNINAIGEPAPGCRLQILGGGALHTLELHFVGFGSPRKAWPCTSTSLLQPKPPMRSTP